MKLCGNMKNKRRNTAIVLLLCLLCAGCKPAVPKTPADEIGGVHAGNAAESPPPAQDAVYSVSRLNAAQNAAAQRVGALPGADFGGFRFTIAAVTPQTFLTESDGTFADTSIYFRNQLLKDKYHIDIDVIKLPGAEQSAADLRAASNAGLQYADMISIPMRAVGIFAADQLLLNLRSLPFLDFGADYMKRTLAEEMTVKGRTYCLFGDAALQNDYGWVMFFNKKLASGVSAATPYELVKSGDWTWDTVLWMAAQLPPTDKPWHTGRGEPELRIYGQGNFSGADLFRNAVWESGNQRYFSKDSAGYFEMDFLTQSFPSLLETLRRVTETENGLLNRRLTGTEYDLFSGGQLLFFAGPLSDAKRLVGTGLSFGIVPMPKLSPDQRTHRYWLDSGAPCVAVPANCADTERTGLILNAVYLSSEHLETAQGLDYMNYYLTDNSSAALYGDLSRNITASIAYALGEGAAPFADSSYGFVKSALADGRGMEALYEKSARNLSEYQKSNY